jgi:RNA polymerase sigma-70 factor (ECF subfamily)
VGGVGIAAVGPVWRKRRASATHGMNTSDNPSNSGQSTGGAFAQTRWTLVLRARGESADSRSALSELCEAYYAPVLAFIRREGRDEDAARELTQEFFSRLLGKPGLGGVEPGRGRFRSYLLGAVKHFLGHEHQRVNAAKRGDGRSPVSIEAGTDTETTAELQIPDPAGVVPDTFFDRHWAVTVVDRAVAALAGEAEAEGKSELFTALKPWLLGEVPSLSQADAARQLGVNEGAVRVAVHRLRRRFRELVKAEVAQTLNDPSQVQEELRYLVEVLAQPAIS